MRAGCPLVARGERRQPWLLAQEEERTGYVGRDAEIIARLPQAARERIGDETEDADLLLPEDSEGGVERDLPDWSGSIIPYLKTRITLRP